MSISLLNGVEAHHLPSQVCLVSSSIVRVEPYADATEILQPVIQQGITEPAFLPGSTSVLPFVTSSYESLGFARVPALFELCCEYG